MLSSYQILVKCLVCFLDMVSLCNPSSPGAYRTTKGWPVNKAASASKCCGHGEETPYQTEILVSIRNIFADMLISPQEQRHGAV